MPDASSPIGIFDSGVGGLSVLVEVRSLLPGEDIIYYADSAYFPYGARTPDEIRARAEAVTRHLLERGAKAIVVACNTATSAAIAHLRTAFDTAFIGMEPALKPAAERTLSGRVALLVTSPTADGQKLAALIDRYGSEVHVETIAAPGLAECVEAGAVDDPQTVALIDTYLQRVRDSAADVLALGCTHYAFLRDVIQHRAGDGVAVIEPSEAVARQVQRVLESSSLRNPRSHGGGVLYLTSGDEESFAKLRQRLRDGGAPIPEATAT